MATTYREGIGVTDGAVHVSLGSGSAITSPTISSPTITGVITGGVKVLAASGASASVSASTNEEVLATVTLPALLANDVLRIEATWTFTNSVNDKTPRIRLDGIGGTELYGPVKTTTASQFVAMVLKNRNSTSSQLFRYWAVDSAGTQSGAGAGVATVATGTAGVTLVFTGQKESSGEALSLLSYSVELLRP